MYKKILAYFLGSVVYLLPLVSFADSPQNFQQLVTLVINTILTPLVGLAVGIALVVFLWGMVKYLWKGGDEKEQEGARRLMVWGIIALFVMVSVWGLVKILTNSFFPTGFGEPPIPTISY